MHSLNGGSKSALSHLLLMIADDHLPQVENMLDIDP
jgi:hypothetical protein